MGRKGGYKTREYESTGRLSLELGYSTFGLRRIFADGKRNRVENLLGEIILTIEEIGKREAIETERELREAREREKREARLLEIRNKVERIIGLSKQYHEARQIEAFLNHLETSREESISPELKEWIHFGRDFLETKDPLTLTDSEIINEKDESRGHNPFLSPEDLFSFRGF